MKIAVNAGSLSKEYFDIFLTLAQTNPEDIFLFIFNKETDFIFPGNIVPIVVEAKTNGVGKMLYAIKLASRLRKNKADIFISEKTISLKIKPPQLLIRPDLSFIEHPSFFNKKQLGFLKKNIPLYLDKAAGIIVDSHFLKKEIIEKFKIEEKKIHVIYPEIKNNFTPIDFEERELIKEKYADANEFFVYFGNIGLHENLLNLLKAFSFFKKRQKSKMQLLIVGKPGVELNEFMEALRLYRFNKEVKVLANLFGNEIEKIVASAYAMIFVPFHETIVTTVLQAMNHVPLIVSSIGSFKEFFNEAALYAEPENFKDIAEKMMLLFKNENLRKVLIEKGRSEIAKFYDTKSSATLFEMIKNAVDLSIVKQ
jgi:glycosyltransferase involved in cell wall biosynthesis